MDTAIPRYDKPPVIEVALSVQFDRLSVTAAQLGLLWQKYRDRFPNLEEKPELDAVIERFGLPRTMIPTVRFEVCTLPASRLWFVSESGCDLVQIQRDRFIRNWRKTEDQPEYPSYEKQRAFFARDWELFSQFVSEEIKAPLTPNQCEVTYVNILDDFKPSQLPEVLSWVSGNRSDEYLGDPEDAEITLRYLLKDDEGHPWGRLHIVASPAIRALDNKPVVRLAVTARGAPDRKDTDSAMKCLDKGHDAVVRGFTSITTSEMHKAWVRII
ncbi:MAG: TIGR04255 family protein [Planctomycetota bacterium]|nr:TIGR04255 family protein [Planctomycetota bacterium]MDA1177750.1 TIGR04255 family protein [Planctomycetota bacterium]